MKINLAIISPAYPPKVDGVGDYGYLIGCELKPSLNNVFFFSPENEDSRTNDSVFFFSKTENSLDRLVRELSVTDILLNYSGYGYDKRGLPLWLIPVLRKQKQNGVRLFIFFHEISATGSFNRPIFWLGLLQKALFKRLYNLSNFAFCSNAIANKIIQKSTSDFGVKCLNIGLISNIPTPEIIPPWEHRNKIAVVFGSPGRRLLVYQQFKKWETFITENEIYTIIDIGEPLDFDFNKIPIDVIEKGVLNSSDISRILADARFGLIDYPVHLLGKSGIFAAYAAFGVVPICMHIILGEGSDKDVYQNQNFIYIDKPVDLRVKQPKLISQDLRSWYFNNNRIELHSKKILDTIYQPRRNDRKQ